MFYKSSQIRKIFEFFFQKFKKIINRLISLQTKVWYIIVHFEKYFVSHPVPTAGPCIVRVDRVPSLRPEDLNLGFKELNRPVKKDGFYFHGFSSMKSSFCPLCDMLERCFSPEPLLKR